MASVPPSFHTVCCMYPTHRPFTDSWCLCESYSASSDGRSSWSVSDTGCTQSACLLWGKRKQKKRTALTLNKNPWLCLCVPGDRPVWVRACRCSSSLRVKRFPQKTQLQTKGLSPVCNLTWALRSDVFLKVFSHPGTWQMCFLLPTSPGLWPEYSGQDRATSNQLIGNSEETDDLCCSLSRHTRASKGTCHTHLLSASLQLGHVQAIRLFFSPGWLGSSRVRVWSTWRVGCPGVVASCSPVPCMVWTVRCCWPDKQVTHRPREREKERNGASPINSNAQSVFGAFRIVIKKRVVSHPLCSWWSQELPELGPRWCWLSALPELLGRAATCSKLSSLRLEQF